MKVYRFSSVMSLLIIIKRLRFGRLSRSSRRKDVRPLEVSRIVVVSCGKDGKVESGLSQSTAGLGFSEEVGPHVHGDSSAQAGGGSKLA